MKRESSWTITSTYSRLDMRENVNSQGLDRHSLHEFGGKCSVHAIALEAAKAFSQTDNNAEAFRLCNTRCCSQSKEGRDRRLISQHVMAYVDELEICSTTGGG